MTDKQAIVDDLVNFYGPFFDPASKTGNIVPSRQQWQAVVDNPHQGSIVIINFIKLREFAAYPDGSEPQLSGLEAMMRYSEVSHQKVSEVGGEFIVQGMFGGTIIGSDNGINSGINNSNDQWDGVGIVRYPSIQAFIALFTDAEYRRGHDHRIAATERHNMYMTLS